MSRTEPDPYGNPRSGPGTRSTQKYGLAPSAKRLPTVRCRQRYRQCRLQPRRQDPDRRRQPIGLLKEHAPYAPGVEHRLAGRTDSAEVSPEVRVVKTLNTMNAYLMVDPAQLAAADRTVFVNGNDADAKATVTVLLQSFG
jgi:hypothetical protein